MPNVKIWTDEEKVDLAYQSAMLARAGDKEESIRLLKTAPLPPYLAKVIKDKVGLDCLLNLGWNLSEVEAEFGSDWLHK